MHPQNIYLPISFSAHTFLSACLALSPELPSVINQSMPGCLPLSPPMTSRHSRGL